MMIESNYEINVARACGKGWDGEEMYSHYCRIELGWTLPKTAREKFSEIAERFPAPEFHLQLMYVDCRGKELETNYRSETA